MTGEVQFDDVWFRYGDEWTLRGVDLDVPAGTKLALVGETGSGKTTVGYLAARLYDPERGTIRLDGDGPARAALRLAGRRGRRRLAGDLPVPRHRCARTCASRGRRRPTRRSRRRPRAAQIHDTIAALPDGYDTVVGERGFRFSGGERQRIAIARTILRNPPVLVLDEATSALDVQTERAVGEALERLAEGRTTIVIAHRLSTVRDADQIAVLDGGVVVERGTHEELLAAGGRYAELVARDGGVAMPPRTSVEWGSVRRLTSYAGRCEARPSVASRHRAARAVRRPRRARAGARSRGSCARAASTSRRGQGPLAQDPRPEPQRPCASCATPRAGSVTEAKIVNGAVTPRKLARARSQHRRSPTARSARRTSRRARSTGAQIADGSLDGARPRPLLRPLPLNEPIPALAARRVLVGRAGRPAAERAGADISRRPRARRARRERGREKQLTFNVKLEPARPSAAASCSPRATLGARPDASRSGRASAT